LVWAGPGWRVTVTESEVTVEQSSGSVTVPGAEAASLAVRRRWRRRTLVRGGEPIVRLRGMSRVEADGLGRALRELTVRPAVSAAVRWHDAVVGLVGRARTEQRWFPTEAVDGLSASRPERGLFERVRATGLDRSFTGAELEAVAFVDVDLERLVAETNEAIVAGELVSQRSFFDTIEKSRLTDEQARAVLCFDNRVQVLAAAGSGKTSVMVARAAYAVSRGFVAPGRILVLAFNKAAAAELQERVEARFAAAGIDSVGLRASTFHSFGLEVIGRATGEKPRLASWLSTVT
jgi:DNA helicase-4